MVAFAANPISNGAVIQPHRPGISRLLGFKKRLAMSTRTAVANIPIASKTWLACPVIAATTKAPIR